MVVQGQFVHPKIISFPRGITSITSFHPIFQAYFTKKNSCKITNSVSIINWSTIGAAKASSKLLINENDHCAKMDDCAVNNDIFFKKLSVFSYNTARWYTQFLKVFGVGFKIKLFPIQLLNLDLGRSHNIFLKIPFGVFIGVTFPFKKNGLVIKSSSLTLLKPIVNKIQKLRAPDIYKGKGVQLKHFQYRLRPGKKKNH